MDIDRYSIWKKKTYAFLAGGLFMSGTSGEGDGLSGKIPVSSISSVVSSVTSSIEHTSLN